MNALFGKLIANRTQLLLATCTIAIVTAPIGNVHSQENSEFFEKRIRPLLINHCLECHGQKKQESGLRLDSREAAARGGEIYGPALNDKMPLKSSLLAAIRHQGDVAMPPDGKLSPTDIKSFEQWLLNGAFWPDSDESSEIASPAEQWKDHWAATLPKHVRIPSVKNRHLIYNPVDSFVINKLDQNKLEASVLAEPRTIIKRTYHSLIGLPPTREQITDFETQYARDSKVAMTNLVDSLLASRHYGERWARHWMDVARYADTKGYVRLNEQPNFYHAWTYRDYVINSFNDDLPYDQFIKEQLAADLMIEGPDNRSLAALGFLTLGRRFTGNQHDIIDDRIDIVSRGLLGITVTCARCHDHKFDAIPTKDYYALYGMFASTTEPSDLPFLIQGSEQTPFLGNMEEYAAKRAELDKQIEEFMPATLDMLRADTTRYLHGVLKGRKVFLVPLPAAKGELRQTFVERWIEYLEGIQIDRHPVFEPWHLLRSLSNERFEFDARRIISQLKSKSDVRYNRLVIDALEQTTLNSMQDVATAYGSLLESVHAQWRELKATSPDRDRFEDDAREQLRQVLYGTASPFAITPREALDAYLLDADWNMKLSKSYLDFDAWLASTNNEPAKAHVLYDSDRIHEPHVFIRGNPERTGELVKRAAPSLLGKSLSKPFTTGSGRLELAEAIAHPNNPLTARVMVNRVWKHHFGAGLVTTTSNFGLRANPPSHPALLDYLALRFMKDGWSIKSLHRLILLSRVWQQSSDDRPEAREVDPSNRLLWRANRRRVDFETYRDSLLLTSGQLDPTIGGRSIPLEQADNTRRTVYGFINRISLPPVLRLFGFPTPDAHSDNRPRTTVPQQSLYMMNSPFVSSQARLISDRAIAMADGRGKQSIASSLFELILGRTPNPAELERILAFVQEQSDWQQVAHTLILSNEFLFID